ncbi:hypothetical protein MRX96_021906 [Rhipicephalus microplus]
MASELPRVKFLDLSHNRIANLSPRSFQASSQIHVLLLSPQSAIVPPRRGLLEDGSASGLGPRLQPHRGSPGRRLRRDAPSSGLFVAKLRCPGPSPRRSCPLESTLTSLDLSHNRIKLIAATEFDHLSNLEHLNLSCNKILILPGQVFANLSRLVVLDVSRNPLLRVDPGSLDLPVTVMSLDDCNLTSVPDVNAPNLVELSLSSNEIANVSEDNVREFGQAPKARPVVEPPSEHRPRAVGSGSFKLLHALHDLDITGLQLVFLDARTLEPLRCLRSVRTNTYSSARAFRLQEMLFQAKALQRLAVQVDEATLSYQIQWAFSKKIKELTVSGAKLRSVAADAFEGLHPHRPLHVPDSGLSSAGDAAGRAPAETKKKRRRPSAKGAPTARHRNNGLSHYVSSSFSLRGTPWSCDCRLLWFQRRLLRQRRQQSESTEAGYSAEPRCTVPGSSDRTVAISDLRPNTPHCAGHANSRGNVAATDSLAACCFVMVTAALQASWLKVY